MECFFKLDLDVTTITIKRTKRRSTETLLIEEVRLEDLLAVLVAAAGEAVGVEYTTEAIVNPRLLVVV